MFKSSMANTIKAALCLVILQSCAAAQIYDQNCADIASSAGHTYERMFGGDVVVAIGPSGETLHAQAFVFKGDELVWLTVTTYRDYRYYNPLPILVVDAYEELDLIDEVYTLKEFDTKYMRRRK